MEVTTVNDKDRAALEASFRRFLDQWDDDGDGDERLPDLPELTSC